MHSVGTIIQRDSAQASPADNLSARDIFDVIPAGVAVVDEQGKIVAGNGELGRQFGYVEADLLGQSVDILLPPEQRQHHAEFRNAFGRSSGVRAMGAGRPLSGFRSDGTTFPIEVGLQAFSGSGQDLVLAIVSDRSEQQRLAVLEATEKRLEFELAHQVAVSLEMGHRLKNLLATIAALISLSARGANTPSDMEQSLRGRVMALSAVVDLSLNTSTTARPSITLRNILNAVLAPYASVATGNVVLSGPDLFLRQRSAEVLTLVFHELATNAAKYGALRNPLGKLMIEWRVSNDQLAITWREDSLDFTALEPRGKGFGSVLLARMIDGELAGRIERLVAANGWTTTISLPLSSVAA